MSEWISVKDRLPEMLEPGGSGSDYVLVALSGYVGLYVGYIDCSGAWHILIFAEMYARWLPEALLFNERKVTHWMPMPEVPELPEEEER